MKSLLITNGHLVTLDDKNRFIENGSIFVEGNHIVDVGTFPADKYKVDRTIDARGSLVMPGLINAHHHLYSTFARGFTPPGPPATNFEENLKSLWWKLDMRRVPDVRRSSTTTHRLPAGTAVSTRSSAHSATWA
jgi:cytosine/adenosine deaminase-related metal-dependent hydrolase